jgi:hypothetical protein
MTTHMASDAIVFSGPSRGWFRVRHTWNLATGEVTSEILPPEDEALANSLSPEERGSIAALGRHVLD